MEEEKKLKGLLKSAVLAALEAEEIETSKPFVIEYFRSIYRDALNILTKSVKISENYERFKPIFLLIVEELGGSFMDEKKAKKFFRGSSSTSKPTVPETKSVSLRTRPASSEIERGAEAMEYRHRGMLGNDY